MIVSQGLLHLASRSRSIGGAACLVPGTSSAGSAGGSPGVPFTHQLFNGVIGPLTQQADGVSGESTYKNPPSPICTPVASAAANVNTDVHRRLCKEPIL
jgi:hypothetical protein